MNAKKCLEKLREVKDVAFATVDKNGEPQVRIIDVMIVEEERLYFVTARGKDFYKELIKNEKVAIVGLTKEFESIRVNGTAKRLKNQKVWIDRVFEENPIMNGVYPGDSRYILDAFVIEEGIIEYFNLSKEPIFRQSFNLGKANIEDKGFIITDKCVGCSKCKKNCPQKCIDKGTPYKINQENCLHCGLCYEGCPVKAITRRGEVC